MAEMAELKKTLKQWEACFMKDQNRKPGKTDIDGAPAHIKDAYLKYTQLKKGHQKPAYSDNEQKMETTGSVTVARKNELNKSADEGEKDSPEEDKKDNVEVWGSQFDRKITNNDGNCSQQVAKDSKSKSSFLDNLGKKMFQQSLKMNKLQMVKSGPVPWRKPDTPRRGLAPFENQSTTKHSDKPETVDNSDTLLVNSTRAQKDELTEFKEPDHAFPDESDASDIPPEFENKPAKFGKLFDKAVTITKQKRETCNVTSEGDVYLRKFQTGMKQKQSLLPQNLSKLVSKHREQIQEQLENECNMYSETGNVFDNSGNMKDDSAEIDHDAGDTVDGDTGTHSWNVPVRNLIVEDMRSTANSGKKVKKKPDKMSEQAVNKSPSSVTKVKSRTAKITSQHQSQLASSWDDENVEKLNTSTKGNPNVYEFDTIEEKDKEPLLKSKQGKRSAASKRKVNRIDSSDDNQGEKEDDDDGDEENVEITKKKKRVAKSTKTAPAAKKRKANTGDVVNDDEDKTAQTKPAKRPVARSKPVSNDNFIRLNMKVKTYQRKGKHMSGPQYKRKMWKQKMQARSKSLGDSCFKCGQSGHWANKCPGNKSANYDKEPVMDEDFPSMQEAAMLAKGVRLDQQRQPSANNQNTAPSSNNTVDNMAEAEGSMTIEPVKDTDVDLEIQSEIVRSRHEVTPAPPAMDPLVQCEGETVPDTPDFVWKGLKKFGYDEFRPGQETAVMRILSGLSTLVVLSTGGGKSLCYQLAAYLYSQRAPCLTLVISPLVSLMEDQVTGLPNGIRGVCLHTNMTASQREGVLSAVKDGKAQFLLVSPEAIAGGSMSLISSMSSLPPIAFVCIDEAHCLSEWSHNFRPSYLRLCKVLQDKLGVQCFLGLTATATLSTAADVARHLKIIDFRKATVRGSPIPSNLFLSISRDDNRDQALVGLLQGDRFCNMNSIIIYCTRRDVTDRVATLIRTCLNKGVPLQAGKAKNKKKGPKLEWDAESYHAGLTAAQRKRVQNAFMSGRLRVVVATVAFGMGLDKSDVRGIIHYNMPKSFESYVQEIGRAGRDREPAQCHVFLDPEGKDLCELRRHTYANTVDHKTLKKLVRKIFPSCRCKDVHERHTQALEDIASEWDECMEGEEFGNTRDHDPSPGGSTALVSAPNTTASSGERLCPSHERALPIEQTVMDLDVKEEGISTLLCYLELHSNQWVENLPSVYAECKIQCYGGPGQLQAVSKKCPPVAVAIAKARKEGQSFNKTNMIQFPVVEISDTMGWDSGPVKKELKLLQWNFNTGAGPSRTGVMVEFSDLSYHFRSPGDFTTEELDDILQFLHNRIQRQEKSEICGLSKLYNALKSVSHKSYWMCADSVDMTRNDKLKDILNEYFDSQSLTEEADEEEEEEETNDPMPEFSHGQLVTDIRQFYNLYGQEHAVTGRAIARIFHGIASPCFPATTWGRVRRFWRSHLDVDFNQLMKIATMELITMR